MEKREFYVVISKDPDGCLNGEAPQLRNCYGQGNTLDELMENMRKSIERSLIDDDLEDDCKFVGFYKLEVNF